MTSFNEFETAFLDALQKERSDLQGLQGKSEAQLSAWIDHLLQRYLGYSWKEISRGEGASIGAKGSKMLFPDLRINVLENGVIFVECKRLGKLDGPKGQEELKDALSQLKSYIRAHVDRANVKPKTVLGIVTDGNRWHLLGLNKTNNFDTIAEWAFLTDDPRLIAQRLWLIAKPALAQPTSALVEFLARRTLADVLNGKTRWLTNKVNEMLPDGSVSAELIGKWLRDAFSDSAMPPRVATMDLPLPPGPVPPVPPTGKDQRDPDPEPPNKPPGGKLADLIAAGLVSPPVRLFRKYKGQRIEATLLPNGKVEYQGVQYDSCSAAAETARAAIMGRHMNTNGWEFWQFTDDQGNCRTLAYARKQLLGTKRRGGQAAQKNDRYGRRKKFWEGLLSRPRVQATRHASITAGEYQWIGASSGVRGLHFNYVVCKGDGRIELYIDRWSEDENKRIYHWLVSRKKEIEQAFSGELSWQPLEDKRGCRIAHATTLGGWKTDEAKWPVIQDAMIEAMIRLEQALNPHLTQLRMEFAAEAK